MHLIDPKYLHTRVLGKKSIFSMMHSLEKYGQITPVTVVSNAKHYVLIDGYLRIKAISKLGWDMLWAFVLNTNEHTALIQSLAKDEARAANALEQAAIIQELNQNFQLSLSQIAREMGKNKSWVKRRLDLLQSLPDNILDLIRTGHISVWAASRILAPLARANDKHAVKLSEYLVGNSMTARDLEAFYKAYEKSTKAARENMVDNPGLFLKVQEQKENEAQAEDLRQGPEGQWFKHMQQVCAILRRVKESTKNIFASLDQQQQNQFLKLLSQNEELLNDIAKIASQGENNADTANGRDHKTNA
ncbi:MAG TPA: ParB/RepB/Spo0J family partition protein [Desulfohalobiaceae bacterium]|nr:ParB/RepB/Spo0J family partition protein [Desulfohalobiaceae bacterium]